MRITIQKNGSFRPEIGKGEVLVEYNVPTPYQIEEAVGDHIATKLWNMCVTKVEGLEDENGNPYTKKDVAEKGPWLLIQETCGEILSRSRLTEAEKNV